MRRRLGAIVGCFVALTGCGSSSSHATKPSATAAPATTSAISEPAGPDPQVWLCKPDQSDDPCLTNLDSTAVAGDGAQTVVNVAPAAEPKIDCFYVYPTVSQQTTPNANLAIDPAEVGVAVAQAARYSQVCRVFAPIYRQGTLSTIGHRSATSSAIAFQSLRSAWKDYLVRYNDGRGIVLIGHSQGAILLRQLIAEDIEPDASVRDRIVSAILLGANVLVPAGKDVGGDFTDFAACRGASQVGCVIAYSSFDHTPPPNSLFGHAPKGEEVLCTNPAALAGGSGALDPYFPARQMNSIISFPTQPDVTTAWVNYPDLFRAECEHVDGTSWLQITDTRKPGDRRPHLADALGPTWGLHIYDGNIALGDLVDIVRSETAAWQSRT
jgi:hypothetical protein